MATLYVTEFEELCTDSKGRTIPAGKGKGKLSTLPIGSASTATGTLRSSTTFVRISSDVACFVEVAPSASVGGIGERWAQDHTEFRGVIQGGNFRIAVKSE